MFADPELEPSPDALPYTLEIIDGTRLDCGRRPAYARVPCRWLDAAQTAGEMCELLVPRVRVEDVEELRLAHELATRCPEWTPLLDRRARADLLDRALEALSATRI